MSDLDDLFPETSEPHALSEEKFDVFDEMIRDSELENGLRKDEEERQKRVDRYTRDYELNSRSFDRVEELAKNYGQKNSIEEKIKRFTFSVYHNDHEAFKTKAIELALELVSRIEHVSSQDVRSRVSYSKLSGALNKKLKRHLGLTFSESIRYFEELGFVKTYRTPRHEKIVIFTYREMKEYGFANYGADYLKDILMIQEKGTPEYEKFINEKFRSSLDVK